MEVPIEVCEFEFISELYLTMNKLRSLPLEFMQLFQLRILSLSENCLATLPDYLGTFTILQELHLACNEIHTLPTSLTLLTQLHTLNYSHNGVTCMDDTLCGLVGLKTLDLSDNRIPEVSTQISRLSRLQILDLSDNEGLQLREELCSLAHLTQLILRNAGLHELTPSLSKLSELCLLDLSQNHLTCLPSSFSNLQHLRTIKLIHNELTSFPKIVLQRLSVLYLDHNHITEIPADLDTYYTLSHLSFNQNKITTLPPCNISALKQLTELWVQHNPLLHSIPAGYTPANFPNLQRLHWVGSPGKAQHSTTQLNTHTQHIGCKSFPPAELVDTYALLEKGKLPARLAEICRRVIRTRDIPKDCEALAPPEVMEFIAAAPACARCGELFYESHHWEVWERVRFPLSDSVQVFRVCSYRCASTLKEARANTS